MGTNYYWHEPACEHCGHEPEPRHLGKSSYGWVFALKVQEDLGLHDWASILAWLSDQIKEKKGKILSEYGEEESLEDFVGIVTSRHYAHGWGEQIDRFMSSGRYLNEEDFHRKNHSLRGPNGLCRHQTGLYCESHGEGTWDMILGEFS